MIQVACDYGRKLQAKDQDAGKRAKCPTCGRIVLVPGDPMAETAALTGATLTGASQPGINPSPAPSAKATKAPSAGATTAASSGQTHVGAAHDSSPDDVPKRLGGYEVRRRLGAGAMGEVWLGHDASLDRPVAIKVLPRQVAQDPERRKRFLREARLAGQLIHTHCVAVYQAEVQDQWPFIAMEFVDGPTLDAHVAQHGPLPWREAARILRDAAAGLAAAHALGLVHRDVKPANLMRTSKGVVKVVDFGLARAQLSDTQLSQQGMAIGTPAFMPPEQWASGDVDARSDVYALCCTGYFLLTRRVPFDAPNFAALGYQHRYEPFPDPRLHVARVPDALCRVLLKGTAKQPEGRYSNAQELIAALDALLAQSDEEVAYGTPWDRFSAAPAPGSASIGARWKRFVGQARRRPVLAGSIAAAFLALLVLSVLMAVSRPMGDLSAVANSGPSTSPERPPPAPSPPEPVGAGETPPVAADTQQRQPVEDSNAATSPAPDGGQSGQTAAARADDNKRSDDAELLPLDEIAPEFVAADAATVSVVTADRAQALAGLDAARFELVDVLSSLAAVPTSLAHPMQPTPPTATPPIDLPQRFVLNGQLAAIRAHEQSTWVYLWAPPDVVGPRVGGMAGGPAPGPFGGPFPGGPVPGGPIPGGPGTANFVPVPWCVGIEFSNADLTDHLADYRVGEDVSVVVERRDWGAIQPPAADDAPNAPVDATMFLRHVGEFQFLLTGNNPPNLRWCLRGIGLEKANQPESWVSNAGRAATLAN